MINIKNKSDCTGCGACKSICPENCITMKTDSEGFNYPVVNKNICINCSACEKACPVLSNQASATKNCCAAYSKDEQLRINSSSGGIFSVLATEILSRGGVVFGAAFAGVTEVKHIYIDNIDDLGKLRTSKYIQSEIGNSYIKAKEFLKNNRLVLFTGTPCQIAGLKNFLKKEYENLFTQDVICHGVPSQKIWNRYIKQKQKEGKTNILGVNFRSKEYGWKDFSLDYKFIGFSEKTIHRNDLFFKAFLKNIILRPSCYNCKFKGNNFFSDITLGDLWGIENVLPELDDNKGISLVICNSDKGNRLLTDISNSIIIKDIDYAKAVMYNPAAEKSVKKPGSRDLFFKYIKTHNINKSLSLFCSDEQKDISKVQFLEDYNDVKNQKGKLFAVLWAVKNKTFQN